MIVCICRRLNETAVNTAIAAGARTPEAVQAHHGCTFNCGKCRSAIAGMIGDHCDAHVHEDMLQAAE
jgi:bacterioferritin-associated ferredoxin